MKKIVMLCMLCMPVCGWAADWSLDGNQSTLNFVSVKKGAVGEVHHFNGLKGSIDDGQAKISVDLSSVETGVAIRNERMQSMLFDVSHFATATITADISRLKVAALKPGETLSADLPLTLDLHGMRKDMHADVTVVALDDGSLLVSSRAPVIVKAADFGLDAGIEALREVAKLPSIATAVPVTFQLHFSR